MIAKRYVQSLINTLDASSLDNTAELFAHLETAYTNAKFNQIINSTDVEISTKTSLILEMVKIAQSSEINNFIKLLGENGRLELIPAISRELKRQISVIKRSYHGRIYSILALDSASVDTIARDLGIKTGTNISLVSVPSQYDGIRVVVDGLNIEIDFSKNRLNAQMTEYILKAI